METGQICSCGGSGFHLHFKRGLKFKDKCLPCLWCARSGFWGGPPKHWELRSEKPWCVTQTMMKRKKR